MTQERTTACATPPPNVSPDLILFTSTILQTRGGGNGSDYSRLGHAPVSTYTISPFGGCQLRSDTTASAEAENFKNSKFVHCFSKSLTTFKLYT